MPIRLAMIGDIHVREGMEGRYREGWSLLHERADVLVLAGDLTGRGSPEEAEILAGELADVQVPVVAVLGNHDLHINGNGSDVQKALESVGVYVLDGGTCELQINGSSIGFTGVKGFCGGFGTYCLTPFGEDTIKSFVSETKEDAAKLGQGLQTLKTDYRVAVLHYAPVRQTLVGESLELYPFLGSSILMEPIDKFGADLVVHGHAHHGSFKGETQAGIPVRNIAMPIVKHFYTLYSFPTPRSSAEEPRASLPSSSRGF